MTSKERMSQEELKPKDCWSGSDIQIITPFCTFHQLPLFVCELTKFKETIRALEKKLKWITDLHTEVCGRNVTLYGKIAELEGKLKEK